MKFKAGDKLTIRDCRKGTYNAVALEGFDTEADEWAKVAVDQDEPVRGISTVWIDGAEIPCRISLAEFSKRK